MTAHGAQVLSHREGSGGIYASFTAFSSPWCCKECSVLGCTVLPAPAESWCTERLFLTAQLLMSLRFTKPSVNLVGRPTRGWFSEPRSQTTINQWPSLSCLPPSVCYYPLDKEKHIEKIWELNIAWRNDNLASQNVCIFPPQKYQSMQ